MKEEVWFITELFQDPKIAEFFDIVINCWHVTEMVSLAKRVRTRTRDVRLLYNPPFTKINSDFFFFYSFQVEYSEFKLVSL